MRIDRQPLQLTKNTDFEGKTIGARNGNIFSFSGERFGVIAMSPNMAIQASDKKLISATCLLFADR